MHIAGVNLNSDVLQLILLKLSYRDYGKCLQVCKGFYQCSKNRKIYLSKKLECARKIVRFEYGPIYLSKKYNDLEFLQYYILNKHPIEPAKVECLDHKLTYDFLINNYSNCIKNIEQHIKHFNDKENQSKFIKPLNSDSTVKIAMNIVTDMMHLINPPSLLTYKLEKVKLLNQNDRLPKNQVFNNLTLISDINIESLEYLLDNNIIDLDQSPALFCRAISGEYIINKYPEKIKKEMFPLLSQFHTRKEYNYLKLFFSRLSERPREVTVRSSSLLYLCFCHINGIKVNGKTEDAIPVDKFMTDFSHILNKGVEILDNFPCTLEKEFFFLDIDLPYVPYNIGINFLEFNKEDDERIIQLLPKINDEKFNRLFVHLCSRENKNMVDFILQNNSERLKFTDKYKFHQYARIMRRLAKCSGREFINSCILLENENMEVRKLFQLISNNIIDKVKQQKYVNDLHTILLFHY